MLDGFLKEIFELTGPEGRMFITSDHGFGPETLRFRVNQFLHELGHLHWREDAGEIREDEKDLVLPLDWDQTLAYCVTRSSNGIHIRVADKPGDAGVPAAEYEAFRDQLVKDLYALKIPGSDKPLITKVMLREDIFAGPMMKKAPDLTVTVADHGLVWTSPGENVVERKEEISGMHYPEGVFIACGKDIRQGHTIERRQMVDVTPTLLYSLDLPVPGNLEGQPATDFFEEAYVANHPVEEGEPAAERIDKEAKEPDASDARGAEDDQLVYDQLRALGYVE
jgi:predicted AlkP superfamily phosphohydrolase/phosphomutase